MAYSFNGQLNSSKKSILNSPRRTSQEGSKERSDSVLPPKRSPSFMI
jgi:hypothetical protein